MSRNTSSVKSPDVIEFKDPSKTAFEKLRKQKAARRARRISTDDGDDDKSTNLRVKPLKRADYHDMLRYGIAELKGEERNQSRIRLAVQLGAKPPKSATKNYKAFLEQQKIDKELQKKVAEDKHTLQNAIQKAKLKGKSRRKDPRNKKRKSGAGRLDGQIGVYKRGVQFISSRDMKAHDGSKNDNFSKRKKR